MKRSTRHRVVMGKKLLCFFSVIFLLSFGSIEAKQKSPFRLENDTILHICSNVQERYYEGMCISLEIGMPFYYTSVIIDEGVDSAWVYIPYGYGSTPLPVRLLSIPSSLKFFIWDGPSIEKVQLNPKNPYLCWENGALYSQDMKNLYFRHSEENGDSIFQVPETVENIWGISDGHFSKVIIPERCKKTPGYIDCDTLIIHSTHSLDCLDDHVMSKLSYLYCLSDSVVAHILMEDLWESIRWKFGRHIDIGKIHCPNYDIRKRDTSWMRDSYRLTCVMGNGDTLVGVDTISSERNIQSVKIEGIADENVRFCRYNDTYHFYVTTYDTLYRLPLEVFEKPEERKPGPKCGDFGEVRDSVFTIREGVDSLPYLSDRPSSFRKVIIPKSMHYVKEHITCDSVFIYSDSLDGAYYYNWLHYIDAHYYYVENEQLYLSLKRWLIKSNQSAVVYCPNADISKRDMSLQQNTNKPVWKKNAKGDELKDLTYRTVSSGTGLWLEIEGMNSQDLYVYDCRRKRFLPRNNKYGFFEFINDGRTAELEFAVWTYDTLLPLQQKDTLRLLKRDGTPWTGGYNLEECVLYYVPKGETERSLLLSDKPLKIWRSGDTIPRRYTNRLAFGYMLTNGECVLSPRLEYNFLCLDKWNYLGEGELINVSDNIWKVPSQYKKFWLEHITEPCEDCYGRSRPPMHFYVGR